MSYERIEKAEPAILVGAVTSLGGFLALLAADFGTLQSAAVAFGASATQALLTRPKVYSPKSIEILESEPDPYDRLPDLLGAGAGSSHPHEPAATIGVLTLIGSFLVQVLGGVDFVSALISAAGISGVQTVATRERVYSPVTARHVIARRLFTEAPVDPPKPPVKQRRRVRKFNIG